MTIVGISRKKFGFLEAPFVYLVNSIFLFSKFRNWKLWTFGGLEKTNRANLPPLDYYLDFFSLQNIENGWIMVPEYSFEKKKRVYVRSGLQGLEYKYKCYSGPVRAWNCLNDISEAFFIFIFAFSRTVSFHRRRSLRVASTCGPNTESPKYVESYFRTIPKELYSRN